MQPLQPDLPFFGSDAGYQAWEAELAALRAALERKLGVPFGVKVHLILRDFAHPFVGTLEMVAGTDEHDPRLRLRDLPFDFGLDEISSIHRLEPKAQRDP